MKLLPILLFLTLAFVAQAQFTFTTNNGAITITGYTGSNGVVTIPGTLDSLPVTCIGDWAFYGTSVTNILIPDSVTNLGDGAFFDCESLTNVTLGSSVASIGDWAFGFCPGLMSVCCRGNAPSLGGGDVFYGNLATLYYLPEATGWESMLDGHPAVLWNPIIPYEFGTNNGSITIREYTGSDEAITIPSQINFLPVTSIGNSIPGFSLGPYFNSVQIPNSVTNIGAWAFANSGLTNVIIPTGVVAIGPDAFWQCVNLASATIPGNVRVIGNNAFNRCYALASLTLCDGISNIKSNAFANCSSLSSVTIPGSVTNLGVGAFAGCSALTNVNILNGLKIIPRDAFTFCTSLTTIAIPDSVTTIELNAFGVCDALTSIFLPSSVTNLAASAFNFCPNLSEVYFGGNAPSLVGFDVFYASPDVTVYYLPGTTGWDTMLSDAPTTLWFPQMQPVTTGFGVQTSQFGFNINWAAGQTVVVEATTDLVSPDWQPIQTNTLVSGTAYFNDAQWKNYPNRFYRLRSP